MLDVEVAPRRHRQVRVERQPIHELRPPGLLSRAASTRGTSRSHAPGNTPPHSRSPSPTSSSPNTRLSKPICGYQVAVEELAGEAVIGARLVAAFAQPRGQAARCPRGRAARSSRPSARTARGSRPRWSRRNRSWCPSRARTGCHLGLAVAGEQQPLHFRVADRLAERFDHHHHQVARPSPRAEAGLADRRRRTARRRPGCARNARACPARSTSRAPRPAPRRRWRPGPGECRRSPAVGAAPSHAAPISSAITPRPPGTRSTGRGYLEQELQRMQQRGRREVEQARDEAEQPT